MTNRHILVHKKAYIVSVDMISLGALTTDLYCINLICVHVLLTEFNSGDTWNINIADARIQSGDGHCGICGIYQLIILWPTLLFLFFNVVNFPLLTIHWDVYIFLIWHIFLASTISGRLYPWLNICNPHCNHINLCDILHNSPCLDCRNSEFSIFAFFM